MPDHRHKPRDDNFGGRKPGGKKPRPDGHRPQGPRSDGPGFEGPRRTGGPARFEGRGGPPREGPGPGGFRPDGGRFEAPRSFGRPGGFQGGGGPSREGQRPGGPPPEGGFEGPRPFGRPGGGRSFGPRPAGPGPRGSRSEGRPSDFGSGGRSGGFTGPRPGGFRPEGSRPDFGRGAPDREGGAPHAPRREWQPRDAWTPRPPRPYGSSGGGQRDRFGDEPRDGTDTFGPGRPPGRPASRPGFGPRHQGLRPHDESFRPRTEDGPASESPDESRQQHGPERRPGSFSGQRRGSFGGSRPGGFSGPPRNGFRGGRPGFSERPGLGPRPDFQPGAGPEREEQERFGGAEPDEQVLRPDTEQIGHAGQDEFDAAPADEGGAESSAAGSSAAPELRPAPSGRPTGPRPPRPSPRPDYRARSGGFGDRRGIGPGGSAGAPWSRPFAGPPPADLLGEDQELVAGRHPVEEAFIAHRKAVRLLVVPQRRLALEKLVLHATNLRIPIVEVEGGTLTSLAGFDGHQGIALVTDRRQFAGLDDILARAIERKEPPFVLVLDSLEDPQNFGSLLRTAEASGVHGVIYPVRRQAPLSAVAVKASAGAVEHLLLVPVEDLAEALTDLHVRGLRVIGSDADAALTARQADLRGPVVVVVGSEGQGLGPAVRRRCDAVVRIPMRGRITSLNAAVAGSILLYEASSQRGGDRPVVGPTPGMGEDAARIRGLAGDDASEAAPEPPQPASADGAPVDTEPPVEVAGPSDAAQTIVAGLAVVADDLAKAQDRIAAEAAFAPAPSRKATRRKVVRTDPVDLARGESDSDASAADALLPGTQAVDSDDTSTAE